MPKQLEAFAKDYSALLHDLDSALLQLKEAEQHRAGHDDALRDQARALGQRVSALRAAAGTAGAGRGLELFKSDDEVRRLLASLDERVAAAEADRQYDAARLSSAAGAGSALVKRAAALEKELAAEIAARQKLPIAKTGPGTKALADLLRLQTDARQKLAPRRAALQTGAQALVFLKDPDYFRKRRSEWQAAALGAGAAASSGTGPKQSTTGSSSAAKTASQNGGAPINSGAPSTTARTGAAASAAKTAGTPASAATPSSGSAGLLTAAAFKAAGTEVRQLFAAIRVSTLTARQAARGKNGAAVAKAKASATANLERLEALVAQYEAARQATGPKAIAQLPNGLQLLTGIRSLVAVRTRARTLVKGLARLR